MKLTSLLAATVLVGSVPVMLDAQVMTTSVNATTATSTANVCSGDKLQLTQFAITPTSPTAGQSTALKVTMKNLCTSTITVPYKITDNGNTTIGGGTTTLAGGASATVQVNWVPAQGQHALDAYLDPATTLSESSANRVNNVVTKLVEVAPVMVTQTLNLDAAAIAGKQSWEDMLCSAAANLFVTIANAAAQGASVAFSIKGPVACKSTSYIEAYEQKQLKNAWRVKSVTTQQVGNGAMWQWAQKPAIGGTDLTTRMRITANPGIIDFKVLVKIVIEGPQGTSPF